MCVVSDSRAAVESAKAWTEELDRKCGELSERLQALGARLSQARLVAEAAERAERNMEQVLSRRLRLGARTGASE